MKLFTQEQAVILIQLLIAHVLADFLLQPNSWVKRKRENGIRSKGFWKHITVVAALTALVAWEHPFVVIFITVTHGVIDLWKIRVDKKGTLLYFLWDQVLHLIILLLSWLFIIKGFIKIHEAILTLWSSFGIVIVLLGYLFCIGPCSYIIRLATQNLIKQDQEDNVKRGGRLIGIFERIIIFTLVLLGEYEAIGFLITGKSILRFADGQKKETEYLLVGTMMSYALAIGTGALISYLI